MTTLVETLHCPVCRARFRRQRLCSRCGADLSTLMTLAAEAFLLRQAGRKALCNGDLEHALELARRSQELAQTPRAAKLCVFLPWLLHIQHVTEPPALAEDPSVQTKEPPALPEESPAGPPPATIDDVTAPEGLRVVLPTVPPSQTESEVICDAPGGVGRPARQTPKRQLAWVEEFTGWLTHLRQLFRSFIDKHHS